VKKYVMRAVYLSCGLIVLGTMITLVGFFLGGAKDWMAQAQRSFKAANTFIEDSLTLLPATRALSNPGDWSLEVGDGHTTFSINDSYAIRNGDYSDDYVGTVDEIDGIEITCFNGDLRIQSSSSDNYRISSSNAADYQYYVEDGILYLGIYPYLRPADDENPETVTLFVPKKEYLDSFYVYFMGDNASFTHSLEGEEGMIVFPAGQNFQADMLEFNTLKIQAGSKPINVDECIASELDVTVSTGKLTVGTLKADDLKVSVASGVFNMSGVVEKSDVKVGAGSVEITLTDSLNDYNIDIQGRTRKLVVDDEDLSSVFETNSWIDNNSSKSITVKCALSEIIIKGTK